MFAVALDTSNELAKTLLIHYSFDLSGYSASELIARWQSLYPVNWLHLAVIEALYQGRYKAISVQQILILWQRRGQASFHFNVEFENLICSRFPEKFTTQSHKSKVNQTNKVTQIQTNYSSSLVDSEGNVENLPVEIAEDGKDNTSQESVNEEIPNFLRLAQRHRHPINSIDTCENTFTNTELGSSHLEKSANYTNSNFLAAAIHQSASAMATATALETTIEVATSPGTKRLGHFETSHLNHPPIGQFTPEHSDRSEFFTSKLKAISTHQVVEEKENESILS